MQKRRRSSSMFLQPLLVKSVLKQDAFRAGSFGHNASDLKRGKWGSAGPGNEPFLLLAVTKISTRCAGRGEGAPGGEKKRRSILYGSQQQQQHPLPAHQLLPHIQLIFPVAYEEHKLTLTHAQKEARTHTLTHTLTHSLWGRYAIVRTRLSLSSSLMHSLGRAQQQTTAQYR